MKPILLNIKVFLLAIILDFVMAVIDLVLWFEMTMWIMLAYMLFTGYQIIKSMFGQPVPPTNSPQMNRN